MSYKNHSQSSSAMKQAVEVVLQACRNVAKVRNDLKNEVDTLRSGWKGGASDAYNWSYTRFDEQFGIVVESLDTFREKLETSNVQYDRNEAEQIETANSVMHMISGAK